MNLKLKFINVDEKDVIATSTLTLCAYGSKGDGSLLFVRSTMEVTTAYGQSYSPADYIFIDENSNGYHCGNIANKNSYGGYNIDGSAMDFSTSDRNIHANHHYHVIGTDPNFVYYECNDPSHYVYSD